MEPLNLLHSLDHIWAKSEGADGSIQTLVQHTLKVLECLKELAALRPNLPENYQQPRLWHILFWAVFLHDWGKAATGFQALLRGEKNRWEYRHEILSLAFIDWISEGLSNEEKVLLSATIATHHKDFPDLVPYLEYLDAESDPLRHMLEELLPQDRYALYEWITQHASSWIHALGMDSLGVSPPLVPNVERALDMLTPNHIRRTLILIEKLLRKWEENSPTAEELRPAILLRGLMLQSDHLASAGFHPLPEPVHEQIEIFTSMNLSKSDLYVHQIEAARINGNVLLVAPTGSGKTEAALLWGAFQRVPRIFYTLPYQASMNAMYDRLSAIFPDKVGILHGHSTLSMYQRLMDRSYHPKEAARLARFFHNRSALSFYPIKIFSPYQMLKTSFQLKGFEALLSDFCESAFIFDEIHAYEPKRLAMIIETIRYLAQQYGARFLIMSATMPYPIRYKFQEVLNSLHLISADASLYNRFRRHRLFMREGDMAEEPNLFSIVAEAEKGKQVLVVCNTVHRAQQIWDWLKNHLPEEISLFLLHSRFTRIDRVKKEKEILRLASVTGKTSKKPLVVVATQVVEVSLNLDLDVLFTDPAPLEALLQRFGRINRLNNRPAAPVVVFQRIDPAFARVYSPIEQITRTLEVLQYSTDKDSPEGLFLEEKQLTHWVDEVYQGTILQAWEEEYLSTAHEFKEAFLSTLTPFRSNIELSDHFERLFNSTEVLPERFYNDFCELKESERSLEADSLLVPISWAQYGMFISQGKILPPSADLPAIILSLYDQERGLLLEQRVMQDDE